MGLIQTISNYRGKKFDLHAYKDNTSDLCYLLAIPENFNGNTNMVVESFNSGGKEENYYAFNIASAIHEGNNLQNLLIDACEDTPILLPITPCLAGHPDTQQLSKESIIEENMAQKFLDCIKDAQNKVQKITGKKLDEKIFLHGYSASGVFAQRFALIYPEIIDRCLIGGAAGTIPIPNEELDYPIGIRDYESLFGKKFNEEAYKNIQFGYYVAENEARESGSYDINGEKIVSPNQIPAPMHDMSYRIPTTPLEVGKKQRELYGTTMDERYKNAIEYYQKLGINISAIILRDANHRGIFNSNITRSSDYLKQQLLNFYIKKEPLKKDSINCVSKINDTFQLSREQEFDNK